jgi:MFS family permease
LNAFSFLLSALLIRGMRFEEPHADSGQPLRARDLLDYSPILEGVRYVRKDRRLLDAVFAKAGELMIGPSWVLFTVMGERYFAVHRAGIDPQRGAMLGMSLLMGARGIGAIVGPLVFARWAGHSEPRLRLGILLGYCLVGIGYVGLGQAPKVWLACLTVIIAHCGGSTVWVFSTTLLQLNTEDRFRGRVFAADLGFSMLTIAVGAYVCGLFLDAGTSARVAATCTGLAMLLPAGLWALSMRASQTSSLRASAGSADRGRMWRKRDPR